MIYEGSLFSLNKLLHRFNTPMIQIRTSQEIQKTK